MESFIRRNATILKEYTPAVLCALLSCASVLYSSELYEPSVSALIESASDKKAVFTVIFVITAFAYRKIWVCCRADKRSVRAGIICAALMGICQSVGEIADEYSSLALGPNVFGTAGFYLLRAAGYGAIFFSLYLMLGHLLKIFDKRRLVNREEPRFFTANAASVFFVAAVIAVCWGFYWVALYPGVCTVDSCMQLLEGFGKAPLTDRNPVLHTLIIGVLVRVGEYVFGSFNAGIAFFSFLQLVCGAVIISFVIRYMASRGVSVAARASVLAFYALNPIVGAYSVTMWKDVWLSFGFLVYVVLLIDACHDPNAFFASVPKLVFLGAVMLLIIFFKGTGIVLAFLPYPMLYMFSRGRRLRVTAVAASVLCVFAVVRSVVFPAVGIEKGDVKEVMSAPLQQIARTVVLCSDELTSEQRDLIGQILPYEDIPYLYDPHISDDIKGNLDEEAFLNEPLKYIKLWAELGLEYPGVYAESFILGSYGYWYADVEYSLVGSGLYYGVANDYLLPNGYELPTDEPLSESCPLPEQLDLRIRTVEAINIDMRDIPVLSLFLSIGAYFGAALMLSSICIARKKRAMMPAFIAVAAVFLTDILSPVYAEARYAYPAVLALPVLAVFTVCGFKNYTQEDI